MMQFAFSPLGRITGGFSPKFVEKPGPKEILFLMLITRLWPSKRVASGFLWTGDLADFRDFAGAIRSIETSRIPLAY